MLAIIREGADIEWDCNRDKAPLIIAAARGNDDAVRILLKAGATVDTCDEYDRTPILIAAKQGFWSICE